MGLESLPFQPAQEIEAVLSLLRPKTQSKKLRLEARLAPGFRQRFWATRCAGCPALPNVALCPIAFWHWPQALAAVAIRPRQRRGLIAFRQDM